MGTRTGKALRAILGRRESRPAPDVALALQIAAGRQRGTLVSMMAMAAKAPPSPKRAHADRVLVNHALALLEREGMAGAEVWRVEPGPIGWRIVCAWRSEAFIAEVENIDPREWELIAIHAGWPP